MDSKTQLLRPEISKRFLLLGYIIVALAAAHSLTWRMGNDQALFTVVAQGILDGGLLYRDAWDFKGPLTYYTYAFSLLVWGTPGLSVRIFDLFAAGACAWALFRLVRAVLPDSVVVGWTPIVFLHLYFSLGYWNTAQPDGWAGFILVGVVLLLVHSPWRAPISMALAGVLIASATLLKPTFAIYLALPVAFPCTDPDKDGYPVRDVAIFLVSFSVACIVAMALLAMASGGGEELLDLVRFYVGYSSWRLHMSMLGLPYFRVYALPILAAVLGLVILFRSASRRVAGLITLWVGVGLALPILQGKYFPYHFIPLLASIAVPITILVHFVSSRHRRLMLVALALIIGPLAFYSLSDRDISASYEKPQAAVAAYVSAHTNAWEKILVISGELIPVYTLSGRRPPTRFSYSYPLLANTPVKDKFRRLYMHEIKRNPPSYVLFDSSSGPDVLAALPELSEFLRSNYSEAHRLETTEIWRLKRMCCGDRNVEPAERSPNSLLGPWSR